MLKRITITVIGGFLDGSRKYPPNKEFFSFVILVDSMSERAFAESEGIFET